MKKAEIDLLHSSQLLPTSDPLITAPPKTPQQFFLHTYLALQYYDNNLELATLPAVLGTINGSFSQLLLLQKCMKKRMDKEELLDNPNFRVLSMLILWMAELEKIKNNPKPSLVASVLLPHPNQLALHQYEQLIIYFNYVALELIKIMKSAKQLDANDLLQLLEVLLPRVYYNVIISLDSLGLESNQVQDILFYNQSMDYFIRTNLNYRALCKATLRHLFTLELKQNQMRDLLERACRYYVLFIKDAKQSTEIFLAAFEKATEAARFSLTDEFVLFFKVISKLGDRHLEKMIRSKHAWIDDLLSRYGAGSIIGHPKGEVNPFNVLGIKQSVRVDARKTTTRIIQIYNEYSLFYFKIQLQDHDISLRLFYLGDFQSKVEVKKLLLTHEKVSDQVRSAFVAAKKGIYMIEFDNSYSWINGKNLKFQYVLLDQYKEHSYPLWMKNLFAVRDKNEKNEQGAEKEEKREKSEEKVESKESQVVDAESKEIKNEEENVRSSQQIPQTYEDGEKEETVNEKVETVNEKVQAIAEKTETTQQAIEQIPNKTQLPQYLQQQEIPELPCDQIQPTSQPKHQEPQTIQSITTQQPTIDRKIQPPQPQSSSSIHSHQSQPLEWGQANLSLIDSIFSLLVNISNHTYQFQTNLEDRIMKRLRSYCQGDENLHWTFNSEARDWLKKRGFHVEYKSNRTLLFLWEGDHKTKKRVSRAEAIKQESE